MMEFTDVFEYLGGALYWKERPASAFKNPSYQGRWNKRWAGKRAGNIVQREESATAYRCVCVCGKKYYEHRVIWEMFFGKIPPGMEIDHLDHNGINNKIENLRITSTAGNSKNKPRLKNNTSGFTGVSRAGGRWRAYIGAGDKQIWLGSFASIEAARNARDSANSKHRYHRNHGAQS